MEPTPPNTPSFGHTHFATAQLGDQRRTRSLIDLADRFVRHPGGSLPDKCADPHALQRCYTLMSAPAVTHAAVLQPHLDHTLEVLRHEPGPLLCLHDTTELDYTSHTALHDQLGPIGNGPQRGWLCHTSLYVRPTDRHVLGLAHQILHCRTPVPPGETVAQKRERTSRESLLWVEAVTAVQSHWEVATQRRQRGVPAQPFPAALQVIDVCDRGADIFEFLDQEDELGRSYVIRVCQDRWVQLGVEESTEPEAEAAVYAKLRTHLRTLPRGQQTRTITVHGRGSQPNREAEVALSWTQVELQPPQQKRGHYRGVPLTVWAIRVWEEAPPPEVEAVEWLLVTNVCVTCEAEAWARAGWYEVRWVQEEWHKAVKTGCGVEHPQFTRVERLTPMIALLSVVALSLLALRTKSRDAATAHQPATTVIAAEYVEVLSGWRYHERRELTVREFYLALARLGGHLNRKHDREPGWLVLWRGWTKLELLVEGARASRYGHQPPPNKRSPESLK